MVVVWLSHARWLRPLTLAMRGGLLIRMRREARFGVQLLEVEESWIRKNSSNLPTKTETINELSSSSSLLQLIKHNMHKSSTIATRVSQDMAAQHPVQIGTRGTVGSLIMQEIKYFSQLELSCQESSKKPQPHITTMASTSNQSKTTLGSVVTTPKKKMKGGSRRLPRICSMVEVSDSSRPYGISGFSYRNLKSDVKRLVNVYPGELKGRKGKGIFEF
ncbi:hypothetical protein SADUNF_Sadunf16G0282400 [Salix dunnii]|uniref:Uncharacterized protein n=1 Tax=Salix dunnii TaxID=1413687 RepID=A0A835JGV9_9ROSI|nr:hypothetical protein SADUNF_Sadunf16G0282400 [Salix dunnii]